MNITVYIQLVRPLQWLKNLMIFFPPVLSGAMIHPGMASRGILPFVCFCCASSATYVFNDLMDQKRDARHPDKRNRPLPSGKVSRKAVIVMFVMLLAVAAFIAQSMPSSFHWLLSVYVLVSILYSLFFKDWPIIDIFCISLGFVLRLYAGGAAFDILISDWLFLTVFLLSIFLSVGKRYSERRILGDDAGLHRKTLEVYPDGFLESAMSLSGAAVLVTYSIYSISSPLMVYTVPLCMFGLLRYMMRIKSGRSGDPTDALIKDLPLLATGILWVLMVSWSIYL